MSDRNVCCPCPRVACCPLVSHVEYADGRTRFPLEAAMVRTVQYNKTNNQAKAFAVLSRFSYA